MKSAYLLAAAAAIALSPGAQAQSMPGMTMPMPAAKPKPAAKSKPVPHRATHRLAPAKPAPEPAMNGMDMPATAPSPAPAPAVPQDHAMHAMDMPAPTPAAAPPQDHSMAGMEMPADEDHSSHAMATAFRPGNCASTSSSADLGDGNVVGGVVFRCPSVAGSGTSRLPATEGEMHGLHAMAGDWMLMAHATTALVYSDQGGPRGDRELFVPSMAMFGAERDLSHWGHLALRSMLSLEPLMGQRGYPNLFATGETAHGVPLVDRQHPHDLFMELSARIDFGVGGDNAVYLYGGPVAEPALGPSAFMHRASARYLPLAPISHHWFDSTHISYGVVTAGFASPMIRFEASAFRGREPDENRWDIERPALDSWSGRITWTPTSHWALQVSHGFLKAPEAQHPGENERRTTATIQYAAGGFSAMAGFAAKNREPGPTLTAWTAEANWDLAAHHSLFGRVENVANDELFNPGHPLHDRAFRVTKAEVGYAWRTPLTRDVNLAIGGTAMAYAKPAALDAYYGGAPLGFTLFVRLSLGD